MTKKIGFIINPVAGMGGRVGLKGTDGIVEQARKLGAQPIASHRAKEMLAEFKKLSNNNFSIQWFTCDKQMGKDALTATEQKNITIIYKPLKPNTTSKDTKTACKNFLQKKIDLLIFCGGDGTARDIYTEIKNKIPLLGIPAGVKMHSGIFAVTPKAAAQMLTQFLQEKFTLGDAEIMDLDEERYRKGEWNIKLFGVAKGIIEPTYIQVGKSFYEEISDDQIKDELTEHIEDEIHQNPNTLFLFGSGGTIDYIAKKLGFNNTLLGIDAFYQKKMVEKDLNEQQLLKLLQKYKSVKLVLSPIGAQGFILGRGNLQLSPKIIKKIGFDNIIVIATPSKLLNTPIIRVDTGDSKLDQKFLNMEFLMVVIGYRLSRIVKIKG